MTNNGTLTVGSTASFTFNGASEQTLLSAPIVFNKNTEGAHFLTINTLNWQTGIYFLKVTDGKNVVEQKIVKQ